MPYQIGAAIVNSLNLFLTSIGVGLTEDYEDPDPAFQNFNLEFEKPYEGDEGLDRIEKQYDVKLLRPIKQFEDAYRGYLAFCGLFMLDPYQNANVYEKLGTGDIEYLNLGLLGCEDCEKKRVHNLSKAIMQWVKLIMVEDFDVNESPEDFWNELCEYSNEKPSESKIFPTKPQRIDVFDLPEQALLREYYLSLLQKSNNQIKSAAKKAGLHQSTFRSRLKKLGIKKPKKLE